MFTRSNETEKWLKFQRFSFSTSVINIEEKICIFGKLQTESIKVHSGQHLKCVLSHFASLALLLSIEQRVNECRSHLSHNVRLLNWKSVHAIIESHPPQKIKRAESCNHDLSLIEFHLREKSFWLTEPNSCRTKNYVYASLSSKCRWGSTRILANETSSRCWSEERRFSHLRVGSINESALRLLRHTAGRKLFWKLSGESQRKLLNDFCV